MGGIMSCLKPKNQTDDDVISKQPKKQEMNDEDKAVLDLKKTNRMLNKQIQDLEKQTQDFWDKAKTEKKAKNDSKAISLMRRRKLYQKYLDGARGKQQMIEVCFMSIPCPSKHSIYILLYIPHVKYFYDLISNKLYYRRLYTRSRVQRLMLT
jgi:hypothetical protein